MTPTIMPATASATNKSALFDMKFATPAKKLVIAVTMPVTNEVRLEAILE
jgi:hypothetical protein